MKNILFLLFLISLKSSSQNIFQKTYGTVANDQTGWMVRAHNGNYVIVASSFGFASSYADLFMYEIDSLGNILWDHAYLGRRVDDVYGFCATSDGGYAFLSETNSFDTTSTKTLFNLGKTNSTGILQWSYTYDILNSIFNNYPKFLIETRKHGFLMVGANQNEDPLAVLTDSLGNMKWAYAYGTGGYYGAYEMNNGDFLLLGASRYLPGPYYRTILSRIDSSGNMRWTKILKGNANQNEWGIKIISADDDKIMIGGQTINAGQGISDLFLMKLDTSGVPVWGKTYGGVQAEFFSDCIQTDDGGYTFLGITLSFIFGTSFADTYLVRTDSLGTLQWGRHFGTTHAENAYSVLTTWDHGYLLTSNSNAYGLGQGDVDVIKTDSLGYSACRQGNTTTVEGNYLPTDSLVVFNRTSGGVQRDVLFSDSAGIGFTLECMLFTGQQEVDPGGIDLNLYPNPVQNELEIECSENNSGLKEVELLDLAGRKIVSMNFTGKQCRVNTESLSSGIYFVVLSTGANHEVKKMVRSAD